MIHLSSNHKLFDLQHFIFRILFFIYCIYSNRCPRVWCISGGGHTI